MYWLTGSQQFKLMKNVKESLAGRIGIIKLNSFTYYEIIENHDKLPFSPEKLEKVDPIDVNQLFEIIFRGGGMPELEPMNRICFCDHLMHLDDKHYIIPISSVINSSRKKYKLEVIIASFFHNI